MGYYVASLLVMTIYCNSSPIYVVWMNVVTEGYVRKHYTNVWCMNQYCHRGLRAKTLHQRMMYEPILLQRATCVAQKKTSLKRGQGWLFWLCYSFLRIYFGFTFSIITLNINICFKCCKCLQNFMLLCNHVWRFKKILFVKDFEAQIL